MSNWDERRRAAASNLMMLADECWEDIDSAKETGRRGSAAATGAAAQSERAADPAPWDPSAWDGLSEDQAFEDCPTDVVDALGREIASVTWEHGSWASVYECRGRFFASDEADFVECDSVLEAFDRAGIDRDWFDDIESQWVDDDYRHLLADETREGAE